jgi:alkaline phosphatase
MKKMGIMIRAVLAVLLVAATLVACGNSTGVGVTRYNTNEYKGKEVKYVFLFVGDGFAYPQKVAAEEYLKATGKGEALSFSSFPAQGMTTTMEANRLITDSAAAGTALASGIKTDKGVVGKDTQMNDVVTIAEIAKAKGKKIGIISSVSIDHATPATFYAHEDNRGNYYEIAETLANSDFDYFGGGGVKGNSSSKRKDKKDIEEIATANGFQIAKNKSELEALKPGQKVFAYNKNLDYDKALPYSMDYTSEDATLADFTRKGIELLDNKDGFFIMVEAGKIDWACHRNDAAAAVHDILAMDEAVKVALTFYEEHPKDTLIVVTGDHECGGMTIGFAGTQNASDYGLLALQKSSTQIIDAKLNNAAKAGASFEDVMAIVKSEFGLGSSIELNSYETAQLQKAYDFMMLDNDSKKAQMSNYIGEAYLTFGESYYNPVGVVATHILNNRAGIGWSSYYHTGVPVGTFAIGSGSEMFVGTYDNTDIFMKIKSAQKL